MGKERFAERQANVGSRTNRLAEAVARSERELIRAATLELVVFLFAGI